MEIIWLVLNLDIDRVLSEMRSEGLSSRLDSSGLTKMSFHQVFPLANDPPRFGESHACISIVMNQLSLTFPLVLVVESF